MTNSNYKDGHAHLFSKHVDSINWFSVAIIFKATYAGFEREKKLFYSFIQNTSKRLFTRNMLWTVFMNTLKPGWENAAETWTIWGLCLLIRGMGEQ